MNDRVDMIRARLERAFEPLSLEIIDESHLHAGHAGAKDGKGHFRIRIVSQAFEGLSMLQKHRMIYAAVSDMMATDIHALSIAASSHQPT